MKYLTKFGFAAIALTILTGPSAVFADTYPYIYSYIPPSSLTCAPANQTVAVGQNATFTAGSGYGSYTWGTPDRTYQNIGPSLSIVLTRIGVQTITVTSGTQTASCTANVIGSPIVGSSYPVQYSANYIPAVPNTGFPPAESAAVATAAALLIAFGLIVSPYVRKTLASLGR